MIRAKTSDNFTFLKSDTYFSYEMCWEVANRWLS